jgi:hypothetical protein
MPSLSMMWLRWRSTVFLEITSASALPSLVDPT